MIHMTVVNPSVTYRWRGLRGLRQFDQLQISNSITSIGNGSFQECYGLNSVTILKGVGRIGIYAFWLCMNLTRITIPGNVTPAVP
jgi:hypothetical protein